jgi:hypothetical protein
MSFGRNSPGGRIAPAPLPAHNPAIGKAGRVAVAIQTEAEPPAWVFMRLEVAIGASR